MEEVDTEIAELEILLEKKRKAKTQLAAASSNQKLCAVCGENPGKYKAPCCVLPYCAPSCFKEHQSVCPKRIKLEPGTSGEASQPGAVGSTPSLASSSAAATPPSLVPAVPPHTLAAAPMAPEETPELTGCLSNAQLRALENCPEIKGLLESKELRELITNIDGAPNRIELLDKARANIPEFAEFAEMVLDVLTWSKTPSP